VDDIVREIEALGFPRREVRSLDRPASFEVTGVMSFPRLDFEVDLIRELTRIGATKAEAQNYAKGLQRGGALVFATGSNEKVNDAAEMMNRRGAIEVEELIGREPNTGNVIGQSVSPANDGSSQAGRTRQAGSGARLFAW
jgi:hypothetical protein